jgi:hypothetical protein
MAVVIDELESTVEPETPRVGETKRDGESVPGQHPVEELGADLRRIMKRQTRLRAD